MQLVMFIGLQGAGKSSFYQAYFADTHLRLNGDMLKTRHRENVLFHACINSKTKTVIDKTNPTKAVREPYIQKAIANQFDVVAYYFDVNFDDALLRNNQRTGKAKVPDVALKSVAKQLELPSFSEGFSQIFYVQVYHDFYHAKHFSIIEQFPN